MRVTAISVFASLATWSAGDARAHFGIMMTVTWNRLLTPPMGRTRRDDREDFWFICKAVLPFIGLMLVGLAVVASWPPLSLFLLG